MRATDVCANVNAMPIERTSRRVAATRLSALARSLLDASRLCSIATVTPRGQPHVNTAYFAYGATFEIVWISEPAARHSLNLRSQPSAAVAVFDSDQTWGHEDRGIQLFGTAHQATGRVAHVASETYTARFPGHAQAASGYVPYVFRPRTMKIFDESSLGSGVFVTCRIRRSGDVSWVRTDIYHPS